MVKVRYLNAANSPTEMPSVVSKGTTMGAHTDPNVKIMPDAERTPSRIGPLSIQLEQTLAEVLVDAKMRDQTAIYGRARRLRPLHAAHDQQFLARCP